MKMKFALQKYPTVILTALCLLAAFSGQAAFQFFNGTNAVLNWDNGSTPNWGTLTGGPYNTTWANGNDAVFQGTAATVTNLNVTASTVTFSTANYLITNGTLTLTGTAPRITNTVAATINSVIAGTAGFTKIGTAGLTLSGANTFSGVLTNSSGNANVSGIVVANNNALGATGPGNETVVIGGNNSGGGNMVALANGVVTPAGETILLINGTASRTALQNVANQSATWGGDVVMSTPDANAPTIYANGGSMTVLGNVRGNNLVGGGLVRGSGIGSLYGNIWLTNSTFYVADSSAWTIYSNSNLWNTAQINGGKLKLGTNDALYTGGSLALGQGNANSFTFDMNGFSQSVTIVTNNIGSVVNLFTNSSATPSVFTVNATTANSRIAPSGAGSIIVCGPISIVKNGSFQLALGGANTYTGTNTINGGTLLITNVGTLGNAANPIFLNAGTLNLGGSAQTASSVAVVSGTVTNGTLTSSTTFDVQGAAIYAVLDGAGVPLNKTASGTLTLAAVNTYSGATTVSGGKVIGVTGGSANSSSFTFAPAAGVATTNAVKIISVGGQWSCATLTNTTANGGTNYAEFDYGTLAGPSTTTAPMLVNGDGDVSGTLNIIVKGGIGWATGQAYPLLQIVGNAPASITLSLVSEPVGVIGGALSYNAGTKIISYTAGNAPRGLTWIKGSGLWDINATTNWLDASLLLTKYQQLDLPTFDDSVGAGSFIVTNNSSVTPSAVVVSNSVANYTFTGSGAISGASALTKTGAGSLTIASANTYGGGTVVSNGTLVLANTAALGSAALTIEGGALDSTVANLVNANNNPITLNNDLNFVGSQNLNLGSGVISFAANRAIAVSNNTLTVSGSISAPGLTLTKNGAGTLRQGAANALGSVAVVLGEGKVDLNGAALGINGFVGTTNGTVLNNAGSGQATFTFGNGNGGGTFNGTIADNSTGSGTVAVTKVGLGTVTWGGSNSYSGPTIITTSGAGGAGCLFSITHPNAFGNSLGEVTEAEANSCVQLNGNITVSNKTINIAGTGGSPSNTGGGSNGNGSLQGAAGQTNTWAGIVRNGGGATPGRFGVQSGAPGLLVISGSIRDGLTATGAGLDVVVNCDNTGSAVMFSAPAGVNTYSGQTTVGRGTLKLGANNTIPSGSVLNIGGGGSLSATFDLNGFDQIVGGLTHSAANSATLDNTSNTTTNTLTINQSATTTYTGAIAGNTALNIVKTGAGQLTLLGSNGGYSGNTTVSNGTLLVNSDLGSSPVTVDGGTLGGTGSINGTVNVNAGGKLSPGTNGIGTFYIYNDLTLSANSTTAVEVDQGAATADQVTGLNTVTYGGTLVVTNLSGTPDTNTTFTLFSANTHIGNFSSIVGSPGAGLAWSFTNGVLSVVSQSYANYPTNLTASVSGSQLTLSWPATHQGWILQAQTNALTAGLTTPTNTWFDVTGSESSTQSVIHINPANPTVFYRLRLP
jgi:autotransporter-associated beta strand protein